MPPFTRPTKLPEWASGDAAAVVEPTSGEKALGWLPAQSPPAQYFNWLMGGDFGYYPWLQYVSTFEQQALTWPERQTFSKGFAASGQRSAIAGLDVTSGQTVAGGATVTGGLTADSVTATGSFAGTTGVFSTSVTAPDFGAVNGSTGTFTGIVTSEGHTLSGASTNYEYATARTMYAYIEASEFTPSIPANVQLATSNVGGFASVSGAAAVGLRGRIRIPAGAIVTGFDHLFGNASASPLGPTNVRLAYASDPTGSTFPTYTNYTDAGSEAPVLPASSSAIWRNMTLTGNIATTERGWLHFSFTLPAVSPGITFYAARVVYTISVLTPA